MTDERQAASMALMERLRELKTRKGRARHGQLLGRPIVVALDHELWSEVVERIHAYSPPVMLAVYYAGSCTLRLYGVSTEAVETRVVEVQVEQARATTVGDALRPQETHMTVPVTAWETMGLTELVGA